MRVITGSARGVPLKAPAGTETRPTSARVKEAIFSIIQFEVEGRTVLDLYAGSGQFGIEALSRGAASAVFVDQSPAAVKIIRENLERAKLSDKAKVVTGEAVMYLRGLPKSSADIIFLDPPYGTKSLYTILPLIAQIDILRAGGIIVCENEGGGLPEIGYGKVKEYRYGKKTVTLYRKAGSL